MTGRILEQITYMLRPGQVERTQCIDRLDARGRGDIVPTTRDIDEATNARHGDKTRNHHQVAGRFRGPFRWSPLIRD